MEDVDALAPKDMPAPPPLPPGTVLPSVHGPPKEKQPEPYTQPAPSPSARGPAPENTPPPPPADLPRVLAFRLPPPPPPGIPVRRSFSPPGPAVSPQVPRPASPAESPPLPRYRVEPTSDVPPVVFTFPHNHGYVKAPDPSRLSLHLASENKPPVLVGKDWVCNNLTCKRVNTPTSNLLYDIQQLTCSNCGAENGTSYFWTITCVILNDVRLNFSRIYNQERFMCSVYAFITACNLHKVCSGAYNGWVEPETLCAAGIISIYKDVHGYKILEEPCQYERSAGRLENLLVAIFQKGAPYTSTRFDTYIGSSASIERCLRIKSWYRISVQEVDKITRLLASGVPLIGIVPVGALFTFVKAKQIYHAPLLEKCQLTHAVAIHGSGYAAPRGVFYVCRNTGGPKCHGDYEERDYGADFVAWALDFVLWIYGFEIL